LLPFAECRVAAKCDRGGAGKAVLLREVFVKVGSEKRGQGWELMPVRAGSGAAALRLPRLRLRPMD
jgi:hypothetical protein